MRTLLALLGLAVLPGVVSAQPLLTTFAGGGPNGLPAGQANLAGPGGLAVDAAGNIYVAATFANRVFKVDPNGQLTVVAGSGALGFGGDGLPAVNATLTQPQGLAFDLQGNLLIADVGNHRVRRVNLATGVITTAAGTGIEGFSIDNQPPTSAPLNRPTSIARDRDGNIFIADSANHRVRKISSTTGLITTIAGTGTPGGAGIPGAAASAQLNSPRVVAVDAQSNVLIADTLGICQVNQTDGSITQVFRGTLVSALLPLAEGGFLYAINNRVFRHASSPTAIAGTGSSSFNGDGLDVLQTAMNPRAPRP
jgi:hypothetical protein